MTSLSYFDQLKEIVVRERDAEKDLSYEQLKKLSLPERVLRGHTLKKCHLLERQTEGIETLVIFEHPPVPEGESIPFKEGDWIALEGNHSASLSPLLTGTVVRLDEDLIWIRFSETFPEEIKDGLWHLNKVINESTWQKIEQGIRFMEETRDPEQTQLREVLLGKKERTRMGWMLKKFYHPKLNDLQKQITEECLKEKEIGLIWGPPGTGKTTVLVEIAMQSVRCGQKVMVSAPSNMALDTLLEKLLEAGLKCVRVGVNEKTLPSLKKTTLPEILKDHPMMEVIKNIRKEISSLLHFIKRRKNREYIPHAEYRQLQKELSALYQEIRQTERASARDVLESAEIIACTHAGFPWFLKKQRIFDLLIMDEASQAIQPISWVPLCMTKKVIFAGDPCQLPPTYLSDAVSEMDMEPTLFEMLLKRYGKANLLQTQYRMNVAIQAWPSLYFYDNSLMAAPENAGHSIKDLSLTRETDLKDVPVVFIDTAGTGFEEEWNSDSDSFFNPGEAAVTQKLHAHYLFSGIREDQIGIITPYRAQVNHLKKTILTATDINTVDSFQGREKEIIFISMVRSNSHGDLGFLKDYRRMNVAWTRAKRQLIVIGDSSTLSRASFYHDWISSIENTSSWRSAWEWM
ncbi:MAG: AAA family ATPase [Candidatus Aureabacteria bacterium]|nr:AAA family ATPase [Candidatus Auribacterota bacterium]